MITTRVGLALGGAVLGPVGLLAAPASAANYTAYHGSDMSQVGCLGAGGWKCGAVWDKEADGHGVYAEYILKGGAGLVRVADPDGSGPQVGRRDFSTGVDRHRVCEKTVSCSGWVDVP